VVDFLLLGISILIFMLHGNMKQEE